MIIQNSLGLTIGFLDNGSIRSIEVDPIRISLKKETLFSKSGTNLYLRKRGTSFEYIALIGPERDNRFKVEKDRFIVNGNWEGIEYDCTLQLSQKSLSWQWKVDIKNRSDQDVYLDLFYVQDVGLKTATNGLINEYYVSQYLERLILQDKKYGSMICCRQNMKESIGNPWLMMACKNTSIAASVDGMQFYGKTYRETGIPEGMLSNKLGGEYAGESSVLALQENPFKLYSGDSHSSIFVATYVPDHPLATSDNDLIRLPDLMHEFIEELPLQIGQDWINPSKNLFNTSSFLPVDDLKNEEIHRFFGEEKRHPEIENSQLLSFFSKENNHVVLRSKEILVDRPHAHIMQAKAGCLPDENIVSTTSFAFGVFNSHISQGNTNFNIFLSICSSQFNLALETGQRIFVKIDKKYYLLGIPSAFEMGLNHCRWIYKFGNYIFQVRTWTSKNAPQINLDFKVISGSNIDLIITHHFDETNGWIILPDSINGEYLAKPGQDSMISSKFSNAQFRIIVHDVESNFQDCSNDFYHNDDTSGYSLFALKFRETSEFCMSIIGEVVSVCKTVKIDDADIQWLSDCYDAQSAWKDLSLNLSLLGDQKDITTIREILPWYGINALTHFLTPYGFEQFSGAAWGTRDVSQGPIDLLLSLEKYDEAKQVLCIIFSNQNTDGGWPQWWMFDSYQNIRANDAHGDVVYWCIIALSNYIKVTGDLKILDEILPYFSGNGASETEKTQLSEHVDRLIKKIINSFIKGTSLIPFGGGDWNDSLQPVSKELAQRMISSWTVEMNYEAFMQYQVVYELTGNREKSKELKDISEKIKADFNKYLINDGIVAGYGLVEENGNISLLLHPDDSKTDIHYSILPMNRGIISGIFSKEQALNHQKLVEQYLKGPDGARLMDRPLKYKGGIQTIFQRAESSTYFGREIGLMYVHEHIRYAEALAITGKTDAFITALRQAIPVNYKSTVPCGDIRQSNCYYSSSDVVFKNRYEADQLYDKIKTGNITLRGGWRVYSSGPGIFISLIISRLLGLRIEYSNIIIDPLMPKSFDGFSAYINFMKHSVMLVYKIKDKGFSPSTVSINGRTVQFNYEDNIYRKGGAVIPKEIFLAMMDQKDNILEIQL